MANTRKTPDAGMLKMFRHFQKKKVDLERYVKDFYIQDGLAYISCNIKEYHDIIDSLSVKGYEDLTEHITHYIESNAYYIPQKYPIVLEFCGGNLSDEEKEVITETISDYYALNLGDKQQDLKTNLLKAFGYLILGGITFLLSALLQNTDSYFFTQIPMIAVWFFIWEFADTAIIDRIGLQYEKIEAAQLASMRVVFSKTFRDKPVSKKVREDILSEIE